MTIAVNIIGSNKGEPKELKVTEEGAIPVIVQTHPPAEETVIAIPYRQYLKDSADSLDMRVNASAASPQEFYIQADSQKDTFIRSLSIVISDAGAGLNEFGNLSALTNGVEIVWKTSDIGETVIADSLKSNFEFIRLAQGNPAFGSAASAFLANNVSGTSEAFLPVIDFNKIFGLAFGLKLRKGTKDRVSFFIKDNVSGIDQFDAIAYGIQI